MWKAGDEENLEEENTTLITFKIFPHEFGVLFDRSNYYTFK
jgi:hypothetical protein